jgi:hypothetical protein
MPKRNDPDQPPDLNFEIQAGEASERKALEVLIAIGTQLTDPQSWIEFAKHAHTRDSRHA